VSLQIQKLQVTLELEELREGALTQEEEAMTPIQKRALKREVGLNLRWRKQELRKLVGLGGRYHFRANRFFKVAVGNLKKEIRLYNRLGSGIR
jgi:hypothetical protein